MNDYKKQGQSWSIDFGNMFDFFVRKDQRYQLEHTLAINPRTQTFRDWVENNRQKLAEAFSRMDMTPCNSEQNQLTQLQKGGY